MERQLRILGEYVAHLAVGAIMFAALPVPGIGLNLLIPSAQPLIADATFLRLMRSVEQVIMRTSYS